MDSGLGDPIRDYRWIELGIHHSLITSRIGVAEYGLGWLFSMLKSTIPILRVLDFYRSGARLCTV